MTRATSVCVQMQTHPWKGDRPWMSPVSMFRISSEKEHFVDERTTLAPDLSAATMSCEVWKCHTLPSKHQRRSSIMREEHFQTSRSMSKAKQIWERGTIAQNHRDLVRTELRWLKWEGRNPWQLGHNWSDSHEKERTATKYCKTEIIETKIKGLLRSGSERNETNRHSKEETNRILNTTDISDLKTKESLNLSKLSLKQNDTEARLKWNDRSFHSKEEKLQYDKDDIQVNWQYSRGSTGVKRRMRVTYKWKGSRIDLTYKWNGSAVEVPYKWKGSAVEVT